MNEFTESMRNAMHKLFQENRGTQDLCGPEGKTTEGFIDAVAEELDRAGYPAQSAVAAA
jgi:isocitrate dehydrogenase